MLTTEGAVVAAKEKMNRYWIHHNMYRVCFIKEPDAKDKDFTIYFVTAKTEKRILAIVNPNAEVQLVLY